jgi:hypothetical protein
MSIALGSSLTGVHGPAMGVIPDVVFGGLEVPCIEVQGWHLGARCRELFSSRHGPVPFLILGHHDGTTE